MALICLVAAVLMLDSLFFSALAPLLPEYVEEFSLSPSHAGLLVALDAIGGVLATVPAAVGVRRWGAKRVTLFGLLLVACSSAAFGYAPVVWMLDVARLVQGVGSTFAWVAGLTWLVTVVGRGRRGRSIGIVVGSSAVGSMLGPVLGVAASYAGPGPVFSLTAGVCLVLALAGVRLESPPASRGRQLSLPLHAHGRALAVVGWMVILPALLMAALVVSAPLRLDAAGLGSAAIGLVFLCAAGSETVLGPIVGHWSDHRGRARPLLVGAVVAGAGALAYPLVTAPGAVAVLTIVIGAAAAMFSVPSLALLADFFDELRIPQQSAFALQSGAWAVGHTLGAVGAATLASATTDAVPFVLMFLMCLLTLPAIVLALPRARPGQAGV